MKTKLLCTIVSIGIIMTSFSTKALAQSNTKTDSHMENIYTQQMSRYNPASIVKKDVSSEEAYKISNVVYKNNNIRINYPKITGLKNSKNQSAINNIIKKYALSYHTNKDSKMSLEVKYKITLSTKSLLSIQYSGEENYPGAAYPTNVFYTTNIDMKNAKAIKLSDMVLINKNFVKALKKGIYVTYSTSDKKLQTQMAEYLNNLDDKELIDSIKQSDNMDKNKNTYQTYCYLTKDAIVISLYVPHVMGDHAEYKVMYKSLSSNVKTDGSFWKDILSAIN
ncbi:polysaccharide deacetylase family protein [Anaeromicropila herbilytica]|uniref:Deacetylase PdaC domain-containing protein n=1 Tax=Anaeromicropila herbilytica TaxID=2785025 RepID=A0A7R7EHY2_9FIRM|nr:hypothetical protein [Anaeromicropila herbilytica]BCN29186.1 hypothetical protein bsdtb5_04810 [Anaeromicropila herbilytica]